MTDHLLTHLAPIPERPWKVIEEEARARLAVQLAARKLVDFVGPLGWEHSASTLGRVERIEGPRSEITAARRVVLPLVELRAEFTLRRQDLEDIDRGATDVALDGLEAAVHALACSENRSVFRGYAAAGIVGIVEASSHEPIELGGDPDDYPSAVARAVDVIRRAGISGPYGLAITPDVYTRIAETAQHGGHPLRDHLHEILGGPLVWAPGIDCGAVVSQRGGDFVLESGQDIAIGYRSHDAEEVQLYLEETFTFRVLEPDAAVELRPPA